MSKSGDQPDWQKQGATFTTPATDAVLQVASIAVNNQATGTDGVIVADSANKTVALYGWMMGMRTLAAGQSRAGIFENNNSRLLAGIVGNQVGAVTADDNNVALMFSIPILCTKGNGLSWENFGGPNIDLFVIVYYTQT